MRIKWLLIVNLIIGIWMLAACTKEGATIYQPDPGEPKASTVPDQGHGDRLDPLVHNKGHDVPLLIRDHLITCYAKTIQRT